VPHLSSEFYLAASPILILCVTALIALLMSVSKVWKGTAILKGFNLISLIVAFGFALNNFVTGGLGVQIYLSGGYLSSRLGDLGQVLILLISIVVTQMISISYLSSKFNRGEIVALFHMVIAGMLALVGTDDLVTFFVGLEMASIGMYALVGYTKPTKISQEAAVKYFVLGSIAAAILLFGFGFIFAVTGSLRISEIGAAIAKVALNPWARLGVIFTLAGIGFKLALVPFHMWTADAYEGAPTGLTVFMATAMKVMIVIGAIRLFDSNLSEVKSVWLPALGFMAAASLIFANIMALAQQSLKRLFAYSSIAHSGYMALSLAAMGGVSSAHQVPSLIFYLIAYVVISLGVFAIIMWLENERCENLMVDDMAGLAKRYPLTATSMAVFMFALGGMPPTMGFISKFYVFNAALSNNMMALVVVAAIGSTISLYYYMRLIVKMFMLEPNPALENLIKPVKSKWTVAIVGFCVVVVLAGGTFAPETFMRLAKSTTVQSE
ncbi:MAG: NADH-quinone oxidoreductase subunit N, partial [Proteobacteria bacterium]|nr:NADH-quinone oxidoreductase subunit N [Pseudomonadota bacterium]